MDSHLSRSEKKRRAKGVEQLVFELADLPQGEIQSLPCDQIIRNEIGAAKKCKGGARKRQLKYATKLLRDMNVEELFEFLARKKGSILQEKRANQKIDNFRNRIITEAVRLFEERGQRTGFEEEGETTGFPHDSEIISGIVRELPGVDEYGLRHAAMQFARTRNRKFSRELFRIMKAALEKGQFAQR